jgi:hypothetical protein
MWPSGGAGNHIPAAVKREVYRRQHGICNVPDCALPIAQYDHVRNAKASGIARHKAKAAEVQGLCKPDHDAKTQAEAQRSMGRTPLRTPLINPGLA